MALRLDLDDLDQIAAAHAPHLVGGLTPGAPAYGAASRPVIPAARTAPVAAPDLGAPDFGLAPVTTSGQPRKPTPAESAAAGPAVFRAGMPTVTDQPGSPGYYRERIQQEEYKKQHPWGSPVSEHPGFLGKVAHGLAEAGNIAGDIFAPATMGLIPGTQLNRNLREAGLENRYEEAQTRADREAAEQAREKETTEQRGIETRRNEILDRRNDILEGREPKLTPDESAIAALQKEINPNTGKPYTAYEARVKLAQDIQDTKPERHTNPFEAYAYGTPEEKESAREFLALEHRLGRQYERPTDAEFRYNLYKQDPQTYKAIYGDKNAELDRAQAVKMLSYFDKQRNEISKDFMLDEGEKAQKLKELDEMEKPFKAAAGAGGGNAGSDRVNVVSPDGTPGTIPRSQLEKAKKKGYRVAQ